MSWKIAGPSLIVICLIIGLTLLLRSRQDQPVSEDYFTQAAGVDETAPFVTPTPPAESPDFPVMAAPGERLLLAPTPAATPEAVATPEATATPETGLLFSSQSLGRAPVEPSPTPAVSLTPDDSPSPSPEPGVMALLPRGTGKVTPAPDTGLFPPDILPAPEPEAVVKHDVAVQVRASDGQSVPDAEVVFVWRQAGSQMRRTGRTNSAGVFETSGVTAPQIDALTVRKDGYHPAMLAAVKPSEGPISVTLAPQDAVTGAIAGPDGRPYTDEFVLSVFPADLGSGAGTAVRQTFRAENGEFAVANVPPGEYRATVWTAKGPGAVSEPFTMTSSGAANALKITLREGAPVSGRVLAVDGQAAGTPLADAQVIARNLAAPETVGDAASWNAKTDKSGQFSFYLLPPGYYSFEASAAGAPSQKKTATLSGIAPQVIDLTLDKPTISLTIEARGEDGKPLPGTTVVLLGSQGSGVVGSAIADGNGRAAYEGLAQGMYRVGIVHPSETDRQKVLAVNLQGGGQALLNVQFYRRKRIVGAVTRQSRPAGIDAVAFVWKRDPQNTVDNGRIVAPVDAATGRYDVLLEPGYYEVIIPGGPNRAIQVQEDPNTPAYQFNIALP